MRNDAEVLKDVAPWAVIVLDGTNAARLEGNLDRYAKFAKEVKELCGP